MDLGPHLAAQLPAGAARILLLGSPGGALDGLGEAGGEIHRAPGAAELDPGPAPFDAVVWQSERT